MARRAQAGAYAPVKTALCFPVAIALPQALDLALGIEILTDRVVDVRPCRPSRAYPFAHYALWILGTVSRGRMDSVQRLLREYKLRAPATR